MSTGTLGIVELVDVCHDMAGRNRALFRQVGAWVADEADPALQRWFAVGSHRHAWHAELWDGRLPTIPIQDGADGADGGDGGDGATTMTGRADAYREQLEQMVADLDALEPRIDPALDPSTMRVITLVRTDLVELVGRAPA